MFNGFALAEGETRNILAVWVPEHGLIRPTRLIFGTVNASSYCQAAIRDMETRKLAQDTRDHKIGFQDDSCLFAGSTTTPTDKDYAALFRRFTDYLAMCHHFHLTIKPTKTHICFPSATFYGHELSHDGHRHSHSNLAACKHMAIPTNVSELRSITATFAQARQRVPHLSTRMIPLNRMLRKGVDFKWTSEAQAAFDDVRNAIINQTTLSKPDYTRQLVLHVDASDDGMGAALGYYKDDVFHIICWYSKTWNTAMRRRPVFYREAAAIFFGLHLIRLHAAGAHLPILVKSDQASLQWVRHSDKGVVTSWRLDMADNIDYIIEYIPGKLNLLADLLSRAPMLGPRDLTTDGHIFYLTILLDKIDPHLTEISSIRIEAHRHTETILPVLRARFPKTKIFHARNRSQSQADLTILMPRPAKAPEIVKSAMTTSKPIAILMPADLTPEVYTRNGIIDPTLRKQLSAAAHISLLSSCLVWITFNVPTTPLILLTTTQSHQWAQVSAESLKHEFPKDTDRTKFYTSSSGLVIFKPKDTATAHERIYVPLNRASDAAPWSSDWRQALVKTSHLSNSHLSAAHIYADLKASYFWPRMQGNIRDVTSQCALCAQAKATRNLSHGTFHVNLPHPIRTRWSIDFANHGQGYILTCFDIDASFVEYIFTVSRSAHTVTSLIHRVFLRHGLPDIVTCDNAPEFLSELFTDFLRSHDIRIIPSGGYHPTANARVERNHRFLNEALRMVSDSDYLPTNMPTTLLTLARSWNNHHSSSIGTSPALLYRGTPIRTSLHRITSASATTPALPAPQAQNLASTISAITAAHEALAKTTRIFSQKASIARLNGTSSVSTFKKDDIVTVYKPLASVHQQRASKHNMQFSSPCIIRKHCGQGMYELVDPLSRTTFHKHLINLRAHPGTQIQLDFSPTISKIQLGTIIATLDATGPFSRKLLLGTITSIDDDQFTVHHFGSRSADLNNASFRLIFTDTRGRIALQGHRTHKRTDSPWTTTFPLDISRVLAMGLRFRSQYKLSIESATFIRQLLVKHLITLATF